MKKKLIPKLFHQPILKQLHAVPRSIDGPKVRDRLIVHWPNIDNDIENSCRSCKECINDRLSNIKQPLRHLPVPRYAF